MKGRRDFLRRAFKVGVYPLGKAEIEKERGSV